MAYYLHKYGEAKAAMARLEPERALLVAGIRRAEVLRRAGRNLGLLISRRRLPCRLHLLTRVR